jgi:hypothetical protein
MYMLNPMEKDMEYIVLTAMLGYAGLHIKK